MSAKEKAEELVDRFGSGYPIICKMNSRNMYRSEAKHCALIAVDEVLSMGWNLPHYENIDGKTFWQQVKTEIGNL